MDSINLATFATDQGREKFQSLISPLIQKADEDFIFREKFIANPTGVIQKETGVNIDLPANWSFLVIDKGDSVALSIQLPISEDDIELTDEELEIIAGGGSKINHGCPPGSPGTNISCGQN